MFFAGENEVVVVGLGGCCVLDAEDEIIGGFCLG